MTKKAEPNPHSIRPSHKALEDLRTKLSNIFKITFSILCNPTKFRTPKPETLNKAHLSPTLSTKGLGLRLPGVLGSRVVRSPKPKP